MNRLKNKIALVTGGGAGIGAAIAQGFINEGAKVLITGRDKSKLDTIAATLPRDSIAIHTGDISNIENAEAMVDTAINTFGKLDILVNNASIDPAGTITEISIEQWLNVINININGSFYMTRFAVVAFLKQGGGSIINISSLAAIRAIPAMPAYSTSKAALIGLTNSVALDYGAQGIRANLISPGATSTDMLKNQMQGLAKAQGTDVAGALELLTRFNPIRRPCKPGEIAPLAIFLASDESAYITGQNFLIDGGATIVDPCGAAISSLGKNWGQA
jgi:meso-butanediol dehydrogenase/(S,S)-butanediol dehydrogenase/diacetyl reductase